MCVIVLICGGSVNVLSFPNVPFSNVARTSIIKKIDQQGTIQAEGQGENLPLFSLLFWIPLLLQETFSQCPNLNTRFDIKHSMAGSFGLVFQKRRHWGHLSAGVELAFFILARCWSSSPGVSDNPKPLSWVLWNVPHCLKILFIQLQVQRSGSDTQSSYYPPSPARGKGVEVQPLSFHNASVNRLAREHVYS